MRVLPPDDPPLPTGYLEDPARCCAVKVEGITAGPTGLAWAILLRAVQDGCNSEWMKEIAEAYDLDLPEKMLDRTPSTRAVLDKAKKNAKYISIDRNLEGRKPLLSWGDGLAVGR